MNFRFVVYSSETKTPEAGFRNLFSAEVYAEQASRSLEGSLLLLDTKARSVLAVASGGDIRFSTRHKYPL